MDGRDPIVVLFTILFKVIKCVLLVLFWGIVGMSLLFKNK